MTQQPIELPRLLIHQLMHLAQQTPHTEICGLIAADDSGIPVTCYPVQNCAETPHNRFLLEPKQQIAAMQDIRERNLKLFAVYHSHPDSPAIPSTTDIEQASYPDTLHLIISLGTKGVLEMRVFRIIERQVTELALRLIE